MLKLLTAQQTREADNYTINHEPVSSIDLMERAAAAFTQTFEEKYPDRNRKIAVFCGTGNNGGDGLAAARLLYNAGYQKISVTIVRFSRKSSADFDINFNRLSKRSIFIKEIDTADIAEAENSDIIIDALIGTGFNKSLTGEWEKLIERINLLNKIVVSIDVPTGFKTEGAYKPGSVIRAQLVITFQRPKLNFLLPESEEFVGQFITADIGLNEHFIQETDSPYFFLTENDISERLHNRKPFSHKGTYGHVLIIAGNHNTMGAALLTSGASLYTGSGLTTVCIPSSGLSALNSRYPEVMAILRNEINLVDIEWDKYTAAAIGPGLGISADSKEIFEAALKNMNRPVVIDADAINLISYHYELMQLVPEHSVFTPHVKEFDRLFGEHTNWWDRLETGIDRAKTLGCTIVLKNRYTIIFTPDGKCIFNPTGNPAMASGGMGDVLAGMIASFIAQGYAPGDAAMLSVYIHGSAGDKLTDERILAVVPASVLLENIPAVIKQMSSR